MRIESQGYKSKQRVGVRVIVDGNAAGVTSIFYRRQFDFRFSGRRSKSCWRRSLAV